LRGSFLKKNPVQNKVLKSHRGGVKRPRKEKKPFPERLRKGEADRFKSEKGQKRLRRGVAPEAKRGK